MSRHPQKKHRYKQGKHSTVDKFDRSELTEADKELLTDFAARRALYEAYIAASNIVLDLHCCPACGLPSLTERAQYNLCPICLWEDSGMDDGMDNKIDISLRHAPNYISLLEARLHAGEYLADFQQETGLELNSNVEWTITKILVFLAAWEKGEKELNQVDFKENLKNILAL
jgi:hypothetical protein